MKNVKGLETCVRLMEGLLEEELAAQGRTLDWIAAQELAVRQNDPAALSEATKGLVHEVAARGSRADRRGQVLAAFGRELGVDPSVLTLASLVERLGGRAGRLAERRTRLRESAARIQRANRRLAALVHAHHRLVRDVLHAVLDDEHAGSPLEAAGSLVDAEA